MKPEAKEVHGRIDHWAHRYLENDLEQPARELFSAHLDQCPVCRERLAELKSIRELLRRDQAPLPTAEEWADFQRRLRLEIDRKGRRPAFAGYFDRRRLGLGLAAAAALVIGVVIFRGPGGSPDWISPAMLAREEILYSYPVESAGIPPAFGEAALDSALAGWLLTGLNNHTLATLIDGIEDPVMHFYGADLVFSDLDDEELLTSLKEVL